jgi:hypothetical protein
MFDGRDYHQAFEKARDELAGRPLDRDEVLGQLVGIEWTLWEAIRGAMLITCNIAALLVVAPISYLTWNNGWAAGALGLGIWLAVAISLYFVFKFAVHYHIARYVKGRRFGDLDLPWLPGSSNYNPNKYPIQP